VWFPKLLSQFMVMSSQCHLVLRKTKSFNKSRYSRNRQYYRTGVYWCLWLNVILVTGLYYAYYRFTLKFGYVCILYIIGTLVGLLSFFKKNYVLGFFCLLRRWLNILAFEMLLSARFGLLTLSHFVLKCWRTLKKLIW